MRLFSAGLGRAVRHSKAADYARLEVFICVNCKYLVRLLAAIGPVTLRRQWAAFTRNQLSVTKLCLKREAPRAFVSIPDQGLPAPGFCKARQCFDLENLQIVVVSSSPT